MEKEELTTTPPAPARKKKKTRMVRVDQKIIDLMLKEPPRRPTLPLPFLSDEALERLNIMPGHNAAMARVAASYKRSVDLDADILRQYRTRGYAEVEEPVTDDEEEEEVPTPARRKRKSKKKKKKPATTRNKNKSS